MPISRYRAAQDAEANRPIGRVGRRPDCLGDWTPKFLAGLIEGRSVVAAARLAGVAPTTARDRRQRDPQFAAAWVDAVQVATADLEAEAVRRAYHGVLRPVYQKGQRVGYVRLYSDALLTLLLRARRPDLYAQGAGEAQRGPVQLNVNIVTVQDRADLALQLDAAVTGSNDPGGRVAEPSRAREQISNLNSTTCEVDNSPPVEVPSVLLPAEERVAARIAELRNR
jgi:hypothetical protein